MKKEMQEKIQRLQEDIAEQACSTDELQAELRDLSPVNHGFYDEFIDALAEQDAVLHSESKHALGVPSPSITDIPISDIMSLLQDLYKGRMNDLLQEILSNAEIEMSVQNQRHPSNGKKKEMNINIKLTATAIDRYAGLINMALGMNGLTKEQKRITQEAYDSVENSHQRLQKILLRRSMSSEINALGLTIQTMTLHKKMEQCMAFFSFSNTSKYMKALYAACQDISTQALSADEMAGALYLLKSQAMVISNKDCRERVSAAIDSLLSKYSYKEQPDQGCQLSQEFSLRAQELSIIWPSPLQIDRPLAGVNCNS